MTYEQYHSFLSAVAFGPIGIRMYFRVPADNDERTSTFEKVAAATYNFSAIIPPPKNNSLFFIH
jgi:hypothetical protein